MQNKNECGFVLADLVLTLGIGAVLLSSVWPGRSDRSASSDIASNERAAIADLRSIATAQAKLAASRAIDTDDDGVGEYGYFGELMGTAPLRIHDPVRDRPGLGGSPLTPPLLPPDLGDILFDANRESVVTRNGYVFKMFLPDVRILHDVDGIGEDGPRGTGGASGAHLPASDTGEVFWCCYAWPLEDQVTGHRVFFINQQGRILRTANDGRSPRGGPVYEGLVSTPDFDAAYSQVPEFPDSLTGMGAPLGNPPRRANDGNRWTPK